MSARDAKISRRWLLAGGSAFGWGLLSAPASSQTPEKITYLSLKTPPTPRSAHLIGTSRISSPRIFVQHSAT